MAQAKGKKVLSGDVVFLLHDTHGFPWDLTQLIARERGFDVDLDRYEELMEGQRERATFGGSGEKAVADLWPALQTRLGETVFLGYEGEGHEAEVAPNAALEGRARGPGAPRRREGRDPHRPHPVLRRGGRAGG
jgi:alanyl-tRNA synthetase